MIYREIVFFILFLATIKGLVNWVGRKITDPFLSRKLIHIAVGCLVSLSLYSFEHWIFLMALSLIFIASNLNDLFSGRIEAMTARDRNWGTVFFPFSFLFLLVFWGRENRELILVAMMILTFSDSLAGLIGYYWGRNPVRVFYEQKTALGSLSFFLTTFLILSISLSWGYAIPIILSFWGAVMLALVLTILESFSVIGIDNLTLPVLSAFLIHHFLVNPVNHGWLLFIGIALAGGIVGLSLKWHLLDFSGCAAAFLVGSWIVCFGGWVWLVPMIIFFLSSSLLSHYKKTVKNDMLEHVCNVERNGIQVLANGGLAIILALGQNLYPSPVWIIAYIAMVSAMNSDTWASEIGMLSSRSPYLITRFRTLKAGVSGAVSHLGLIAGFLGSLTAALTIYCFDLPVRVSHIMIIAYIGWLAHLLDSLLGALWQARFQCPTCKKITENSVHCKISARLIYGKFFMNNDMVNFLSAGTASLAGVLVYRLGIVSL